MDHDVDGLQRFALKLYLGPGSTLAPSACIEIFHRWIQQDAVPGLLIDVADYTHLTGGPQVVLVAHEGHYALDDADGRLGLVYTRRQRLEGTLPERLASAAGVLLSAARRLEQDTADLADGGARFLGSEVAVVANDRLAAPQTDAATAALHAAAGTLGTRLFGSAAVEIRPLGGSDRLGCLLATTASASLAELSARTASDGAFP